MNKIVPFILVLACLISCKKAWDGDGDEDKETIKVDGFRRKYRVYCPKDYDSAKKYPLVFVLHGRFGQGKATDKATNFDLVADEKGLILCYPDGYKKSWVDDRHTGPAADAGVDDIHFFDQLLNQLISDYSIDEKRVYSCGMSNGGFMSMSLACHLSNRFAAVGSVTGNLAPNPTSYCSDAAPTGILLIGSPSDPISPYYGGPISDESDALGFPETFEHWKNLNNCGDPVQDSVWNDLVPDDGTTVITHTYSNCDSSVKVVLYEVQGMGHTWPQGFPFFKESTVGRTSQEFNAASVIADFLLEHEL